MSIKTISSEEIIKTLIAKRFFLLKFVIVFFVIGIFVAIFTPKQYASSTVILPQVSSAQGLGKKFGGFAKLVGINLGENSKNEIFPTLYPVVVNSTPFQKEILKTAIQSKKQNDTLTLSQYLDQTNTKGPVDYFKEYTIGLPGKVLKLFRRKQKEQQISLADTTIFRLSDSEKAHIEYLVEHVSVRFNDVEGYIEIVSLMPDPVVSAQLTKRVQVLLQDYIIEYNIKKAQDELAYIENRLQEAQENYFEKRSKLGRFKDQNKNYIISLSENRYEQLKAEYNLSFDMYSQLSTQLESAKLQVKRDTPIFTILKPVTIPSDPAAPNKPLVVLIYLILGVLLGSFIILFRLYWPVVKAQFIAGKPAN